MNQAKSQGFTLLELFIAILIVAILASIAVPAFNDSIARSRITSRANELVGAVNLSRSEAIDRSTIVELIWRADGWEINDRTGGGTTLIRFIHHYPNPNIKLTPWKFMYFGANGVRVTSPTNSAIPPARFALFEDANNSSIRRRVCVSPSGSVSVTTGNC